MNVYRNKDTGYVSWEGSIHNVVSVKLLPVKHVEDVGFVRDLEVEDKQGVKYTVKLFADDNSSREVLLTTKQR